MNIRTQIYGVAASTKSPLVLTKQPKGVAADDLSSIPVSRTAARWVDTRLAERPMMLVEPARVTWRRSAYDVQVINRGPGGAMIAADFQPLLWDRLQVAFNDGQRKAATVVWLRQGRIGIEFAEVQ